MIKPNFSAILMEKKYFKDKNFFYVCFIIAVTIIMENFEVGCRNGDIHPGKISRYHYKEIILHSH